jgi:NifU-like protein involved in Fe-S cluster formation
MIDDLYSAKILRLVANIPHAGRLDAPEGSAEKVSKLCGSKVIVDVRLKDGRVSDFAQDVKACALGQASAAVLGAHIIGADVHEIEGARDALAAMLKAGGPPPVGRFSELSVLEPVKDYPARHASTLLAFEAALTAVQSALAQKATPEVQSRTSRAGAA